ncbi:zinc finger, CCHC-type, retrotransposon gag domain protein [Tanacetum coccineum]|uniref:Zinc finger, CCHC-type, retrotransposon gag domain protein n=1 Tax=Tanacetum coccineum TaxID=301880 RepID=A0ABQ4YVI8_9ASTR
MVTTCRNSNDDVPNFEDMVNATMANALPNLTAALRTQITNDIRNGIGSSGGGGGDAIPHGIHVWIERLEAMLLPILVLGLLFMRSFTTGIFRHLGSTWRGLLGWLVLLEVAAAARNIELLHESGNLNKRDRDGSSGQKRSIENLPPPPLCTTCGKLHLDVCYKATRRCFNCGSTQHKVKDCPRGKQKQSMPADSARLPPTTGRVYAYNSCSARPKTSGTITSPDIENLSVVCKFADVFPDELPGLPPAREIEFGIELIPGAEPILKVPYRMAPVELKELKEQLQEMLENGFIRPSVSP